MPGRPQFLSIFLFSLISAISGALPLHAQGPGEPPAAAPAEARTEAPPAPAADDSGPVPVTVWQDHREITAMEHRTGLRFDRGWFLLGQLSGGFWRGRYLTPGSVGAYLQPEGFMANPGADPSEVNVVYSANVGVGRYLHPRWSLEFNFAAAVGIHGTDGTSAFGTPVPAGSGDRVSSVSLYHLRNRFYLYDFDEQRKLYFMLGGGVTQFNDAYFLPGRPKSFVPESKSTIFAGSLSSGGGVTLLDTENGRVYFEGNYYHTFAVRNLDSNQVYTFGLGFSFPMDARVYTEADVAQAAGFLIHPPAPGRLTYVETDPFAPVTPGLHAARILSPEELRLIAYQSEAEGPLIPRDALEPPSRNGLDYTVDSLAMMAVVVGFKRALNVTSARGLLKGGYTLWPDYVTQMPPWNDGNPFYTNWILHPYVGSLFYMYYRNRGYSRIASAFGSFLQSAAHEYIAEAVYEIPSGIDIILTPGLGVPLGMLFDETSVRWARSSSTPKKIAAYFMNPMLGMPFARFRRGPYYDPAQDPVFSMNWNWHF